MRYRVGAPRILAVSSLRLPRLDEQHFSVGAGRGAEELARVRGAVWFCDDVVRLARPLSPPPPPPLFLDRAGARPRRRRVGTRLRRAATHRCVNLVGDRCVSLPRDVRSRRP